MAGTAWPSARLYAVRPLGGGMAHWPCPRRVSSAAVGEWTLMFTLAHDRGHKKSFRADDVFLAWGVGWACQVLVWVGCGGGAPLYRTAPFRSPVTPHGGSLTCRVPVTPSRYKSTQTRYPTNPHRRRAPGPDESLRRRVWSLPVVSLRDTVGPALATLPRPIPCLPQVSNLGGRPGCSRCAFEFGPFRCYL